MKSSAFFTKLPFGLTASATELVRPLSPKPLKQLKPIQSRHASIFPRVVPFSRAHNWLHIFPRLALMTCFELCKWLIEVAR